MYLLTGKKKKRTVATSFGTPNGSLPLWRTAKMNIDNTPHAPNQASESRATASLPTVKVNGVFLQLTDSTPTGRQILAAAQLQPATEHALLHWPEHGPTQELALDEIVDLQKLGVASEFFGFRADGVLYFVLNDERYAWAGCLTEADIRKIGRVPASMELWLERRDEPDLMLSSGAVVDLAARGVERLHSRLPARPIWQLDVHGVVISSHEPIISVREALEKAGIDPELGWNIRLKVQGQPKRPVELNDNIDLTTPGIERLKLLPKCINNGESVQLVRHQFALLAKDEAYLSSLGPLWETIDDGRRWLLIIGYQLPAGYHQNSCTIAIEVPQNYPIAELDMFYCYPPLTRASGASIPQTESIQQIDERNFQRWSRHRMAGDWSPQRDSILSHMGLIDESICKEVEL
jgi:hypothetical protein